VADDGNNESCLANVSFNCVGLDDVGNVSSLRPTASVGCSERLQFYALLNRNFLRQYLFVFGDRSI
jgi:hypothetical protein